MKFKKIIAALIISVSLFISGQADAFVKGSVIQFLLSQVRTSTGALIGGKVWFYNPGTFSTTGIKIWLDEAATSAANNPYTLDANGTAQLYASGKYRIVIKDSAGVTKFDRDNVMFYDFDNPYEKDALQYGTGTFTQATIEAALTAIGTTNKVTLLLRPGSWAISTPLAFPANVTLNMPAGAYFSGAAVTAGTITGLKTATPEMFGASTAVASQATAINACLASSGDITFSETYYTNPSLTISNSNVTIRFIKGAKLIAMASSFTVAAESLLAVSGSNVTIYNLSVDGNKANNAAGKGTGVRITGNNVHLYSPVLANVPTIAFGAGDGILASGNNLKILNPTMTSNGRNGIAIAGGTDSYISGIASSGNGLAAVDFESDSAIILGGTLAGGYSNGDKYGADIAQSTFAIKGVTIRDITIKDSTSESIIVAGGATGWSISDNNIYNSLATGIQVLRNTAGNPADGSITNNKIYNAATHGIRVDGIAGNTVKNVLISGNTVDTVVASGISTVYTDGTRIIGNSVKNAGAAAASIGTSNFNTGIITGNFVDGVATTTVGIAEEDSLVNDNIGALSSNAPKETLYAAGAVRTAGSTSLNTNAGIMTVTLADGNYIGQIKTIVMTVDGGDATLSIAHHQTSDPEVATFSAVGQVGVFMWIGTKWVTLYATCAF